jgi:hypothetical protein
VVVLGRARGLLRELGGQGDGVGVGLNTDGLWEILC